jgi:hypothetical protein
MISVVLPKLDLSQCIGTWLIFVFLSIYPTFWFGKISADLKPIYKIPKFHISSANLQSASEQIISQEGRKKKRA